MARTGRRGGELEPLDAEAPTEEVDLGSMSDVQEGEALVLRRVAESATAGLPRTADDGADVGPRRRRGPIAAMVESIRSVSELRRTPYGMGPVVMLGTITFFGVFSNQAFGVAAPYIVRDLEIDIGTIVQLLTYVAVIAAIVSVFAGWYLDRHTRIPWLGLGAIFSGVTAMLTSQATSLFTLGVPRVLEQSSEEVGAVPRFSLLADYYPPESRGRVFTFLGTMRRVASIGAIFIVGIAVEVKGWRWAVYVFSIPLIVVGIMALARMREPTRGYMERLALGADDETARREDEPQSFGEAWRTTFSVRTLRRLFIGESFARAGDEIFFLFLPFFMVEKYGLGAFELSLFGLPAAVGALIGGFYGGNLIDLLTRRNPGRVLVALGAFNVIAALGVLGYVFAPPLYVLAIFSIINGFGAALIGPASSVVYSQVIPPSIRTQGLQITGLAVLPGLIVLTPVARAIYGEYGYDSVFAFCVPLLLLGALIAMTAGAFFDLDARSAFAASLADEEWRRAKLSGRGKLLVCRDVDVAYDGVQVLFGVDFDVEEGEIIALLGTNGAGKSTLLRAISGTAQASGGAIVFDGRDVTHMPPHEIAARHVIHMPGGRGVFPGLTVRDNLLLANWLTDDPDEIRAALAEVFEIFPLLRERPDTLAADLSGGEQQQLSLAQAFLSKPRLLMIDELSLGLSPAVVGQLLEIVREIHRRGVTIVVVEQSVNVALTIADKAIFMEKGEVKFFGKTADLLARPDILRAVYVKGTGALTAGGPAAAVRSERQRRELALTEARPVLEVDGLTKHFGGITAVDDVSFALKEGEVLGLIGPNGAGKTTIFDLITGFQDLDAGTITYEGVDITMVGPEERARRGLVRRFQDARLFPSLTVFETLLVALEHRLEVKNTLLSAAALPQARRAERRLRTHAEHLIDLLEIGAYRDKFVKELSTGLRRIVDLACVLAAEPKVLLLDEPSSGIAQAETESLAPLLRRIRFETGASVLIIEHDMTLISAVADELIAFDRGRIVIRGTPDVVLNDDRVIESYLGTTEEIVQRSGSLT